MRKLLLCFVTLSLACSLVTLPVQARVLDLQIQESGKAFETDAGKFKVINRTPTDTKKESGPFKVVVSAVSTLEANLADDNYQGKTHLIAFDLQVENQSEDTNSLHPAQGVLVVNKQQIDAEEDLSTKVGGEFIGNVEKEGQVYFIYEGDLKNVKEVKYVIRAGQNEQGEKLGEDLTFDLKLEDGEKEEDKTSSKREIQPKDFEIVEIDGRLFSLILGQYVPIFVNAHGDYYFSPEHDPNLIEEVRRRITEDYNAEISERERTYIKFLRDSYEQSLREHGSTQPYPGDEIETWISHAEEMGVHEHTDEPGHYDNGYYEDNHYYDDGHYYDDTYYEEPYYEPYYEDTYYYDDDYFW